MRTLLLCRQGTITDGLYGPHPAAAPETLGQLLDAIQPRMHHDGVVVLADDWADLLGTDTGRWSTTADDDRAWARWTSDADDSIWTLEYDLAEPQSADHPLIVEDPAMSALLLHRWQQCTGSTWYGPPSIAAHALLRGQVEPRNKSVKWSRKGAGLAAPADLATPDGPCLADVIDGCESAYEHAHWSREPLGLAHRHAFDMNKAYLSALMVVEVAADRLTRRHRPPFEGSRAGVWRVTLEPWEPTKYGRLLPDPAGYGRILPDGSRWLTTPTLQLIHRLADEGLHGGLTIHESYTAPASRITRPFATSVRDLLAAHPRPDHPIHQAAKLLYKHGYGAWNRPGGRIDRPDWYLATVAMARANLWRKLRTYGEESDTWPLHLVTDEVVYESDNADWQLAAPESMKIDPTGLQLGTWRPGVTDGH